MTARIGYLIKRVESGVRAEVDSALRRLGLAAPEYTALSALRARGELSLGQLARRSFTSGAAFTQTLAALERNGWIERCAEQAKSSLTRVRLTRKGESVLRACDLASAHVERNLLGGLSEAQARALREALESCVASLERPARSALALAPQPSGPHAP